MASISKQLALAVVAKLEAGLALDPCPFALTTFEPERKILLDLKLIDETLRVWVAAAAQESSKLARDTVGTEHTVEIGILKRVSRETLEDDVDDLVELAENVRDFLLDADEDDEQLAAFELTDADLTPQYDHDRLYKHNHFIAIVRCTFRVDRLQPEDDDA
ncbi:MAG: hypothetical protein K8U03_09235 [Planctomycetia bacterium]|nr:hypothetical protein [Planctomycetia bacterium]